MSAFYETRKKEVLNYYYTVGRAFPQFTKKGMYITYIITLILDCVVLYCTLYELTTYRFHSSKLLTYFSTLLFSCNLIFSILLDSSLLSTSYRLCIIDLSAFIAAFHEFDADGSGALDVSELQACFKAMGALLYHSIP